MNREIIDRVFRRDFRELLEFDIFEYADILEDFVTHDSFELYIEPLTTPLRQGTVNIIRIVCKYLEYDPEKHKSPLDQYIYIYENREEILALLGDGMEQENPFRDPIGYSLGYRVNARFERMFTHLLNVGNTHKFDPEYIRIHILDEPDEPGEN